MDDVLEETLQEVRTKHIAAYQESGQLRRSVSFIISSQLLDFLPHHINNKIGFHNNGILTIA
ncbi:hypothetical protein GE107_25940 [Cohnella sp. CFH 77786]|uniref:hypothetical protein n=1 Tax=Cohnella sp. CFH 77786 TaxID=2662265 RepID=UPI001C609F61|nr:hypothetical protein [Cohnella sp. CFH 77786]MBW5449456.1 hypothetical protein [Cohnella sp. CFH 77786]